MSSLHVLISQKKEDTHGYHSFKKTYFMVILLIRFVTKKRVIRSIRNLVMARRRPTLTTSSVNVCR